MEHGCVFSSKAKKRRFEIRRRDLQLTCEQTMKTQQDERTKGRKDERTKGTVA